MQAFLAKVPDAPLAIILCCLPVREAAKLTLVDRSWRDATGPTRRNLWMHLFFSLNLRPPSQRARRSASNLRKAFFTAWSQSRPNMNKLFYLAWNEFEKRDSPKALEQLLLSASAEKPASSSANNKKRKLSTAQHKQHKYAVHRERGFDINAQSELIESLTLVGLAARFGRTRCIKWLVQQRG